MTRMNINQRVGAALRATRRARGVTQDALAQVLHVDRVTISRYESGKRPIPLAALVQIAAYLEQPISALLSDEHSMVTEIPLAPIPTTEPATAERAAVDTVVQVLTRHPALVPTVLDLLETMLDADEQGMLLSQ